MSPAMLHPRGMLSHNQSACSALKFCKPTTCEVSHRTESCRARNTVPIDPLGLTLRVVTTKLPSLAVPGATTCPPIGWPCDAARATTFSLPVLLETASVCHGGMAARSADGLLRPPLGWPRNTARATALLLPAALAEAAPACRGGMAVRAVGGVLRLPDQAVRVAATNKSPRGSGETGAAAPPK